MSEIKSLLKKVAEGRISPVDAVKTLTESALVSSGDTVQLINGKFTGRRGKVLSVEGAYAVVQSDAQKLRVLVTNCKKV